MTRERQKYFDWLVENVELDDKTERYGDLLEYLDTVNFDHFIWCKLDENRVECAKEMRVEWAQNNLTVREYERLSEELEDEFGGGISFLEFLISMVKTMSETMYFDNHFADFFWPIIDNLGLDCMTNEEFDGGVIDGVLLILKDRKYCRDGSGGGLFFVPNSTFDMRKIDYLKQANLWLSYNFVRV